MGLFKKIGTGMGRAIVKTGKATAAAIKKKNLQRHVKRMILERYTIRDLKKMINDYDLEGPELPDRGYYKKDDYVGYIYKNFKLKEVIEDAKYRRIPIKDIMDYYIAEMEKIEKEAQVSPQESKVSDEEEGVEKIEYEPEQYVTPKRGQYKPPPTTEEDGWKFEDSEKRFFDELLDYLEHDFGPSIYDIAFTDEMDFKNHVLADLRRRYRDRSIRFQPQSVDIIIDDKYGLELKFAYYRETLRRGYYEVVKYKKLVKYLAIVILDPGLLPQSEIEEARKEYQNLGAEVVVIRGGQKRGKKKRRREITIRV